MYEPRTRCFPRTSGCGRRIAPCCRGHERAVAAIAALGLSRLPEHSRRDVLVGHDVDQLVPGILGLALAGRDHGATALSVWAAVEIAAVTGPELVLAQQERLARAIDRIASPLWTDAPTPTVEHAWALVALLGAARHPEVVERCGGPERLGEAMARAAQRLLGAQGATGLFPHHLPADMLGRFRSHVGCFADQAYAVQALARYGRETGDTGVLTAAARCADRLVSLQGEGGQWWWHYDWRHGNVVERYPVYSVHQHSVAPMALLELAEAGGPDHRAAVAAGLGWLVEPAESREQLIVDDCGVVWRKVGRHEPRKMVRKLRSAVSATDPARRAAWLDRVFPPGTVDRECRPFELGWLLYAWRAGRLGVPAETVRRVVLLPESAPAGAGERP